MKEDVSKKLEVGNILNTVISTSAKYDFCKLTNSRNSVEIFPLSFLMIVIMM